LQCDADQTAFGRFAKKSIAMMAEGADASRVAEHKMHLKRVKRRMIAAI